MGFFFFFNKKKFWATASSAQQHIWKQTNSTGANVQQLDLNGDYTPRHFHAPPYTPWGPQMHRHTGQRHATGGSRGAAERQGLGQGPGQGLAEPPGPVTTEGRGTARGRGGRDWPRLGERAPTGGSAAAGAGLRRPRRVPAPPCSPVSHLSKLRPLEIGRQAPDLLPGGRHGRSAATRQPCRARYGQRVGTNSLAAAVAHKRPLSGGRRPCAAGARRTRGNYENKTRREKRKRVFPHVPPPRPPGLTGMRVSPAQVWAAAFNPQPSPVVLCCAASARELFCQGEG